MRNVNKTIAIPETVLNPTLVMGEEISYIAENKDSRQIHVKIAMFDNNNNVVSAEEYLIQGDMYDQLMQEKPKYAPNKPAREYREADLFYIIDLIRISKL